MSNVVPPSTIRAWQYTSTKAGLDKNLVLNSSAALPKTKPTEHLVRVIAMALNPVDYKPAENQFFARFIIRTPATPGIDFVGRIVAPASGSLLKRDQLVFGMAGSTPFAGGALSEYAMVQTNGAAVVPDGVDPINAGIIGVAGLTAYQTIVPHVKAGDKVFLNGGSGGVGVFGIQIAKAVGCYVATTCSSANVELCKSLGADEVVDYKKQDVVEALKKSGQKFDHVVDNVGENAELYWRAHEYTKPGAVFMAIAGRPTLQYMFQMLKMTLWPGFLGGGKRKLSGFFAKAKVDELDQLVAWMKVGKIKPIIEEKFAFEKAPEAITKLKTGRTKGKIVIDVSPETDGEPKRL